MDKELKEMNDALQELRKAVLGMYKSQLEVRDAMGKLINDANLKGTLQLLKEDIAFRRTLDLLK